MTEVPGSHVPDPDRRFPWYVPTGILVVAVVLLVLFAMFAVTVLGLLITGW